MSLPCVWKVIAATLKTVYATSHRRGVAVVRVVADGSIVFEDDVSIGKVGLTIVPSQSIRAP